MTQRQFGKSGWSPDTLPDQTGKTFVITGGNSGIGYDAARILGARGANVTILCRNQEKANTALAELEQSAPEGSYQFIPLDLASLASVRTAAQSIRNATDRIDGLINNAGIMMVPERTLTADGFETQFGVNHLGHFALNAALCDLVEKAHGRFVSVASLAHKFARGFSFRDLTFGHKYSPSGVYAQSKLANLVYARELNRRLENNGLNARAYACHPGYSATNLQTTGPGNFLSMAMRPATAILSQSAEKGAYPTVLCAADPNAVPGGYYGPTGFGEMTGPVDQAASTKISQDKDIAVKLWDASAKLTHSSWNIFESVSSL